jgi:superfamily II DNA or RNA helicase
MARFSDLLATFNADVGKRGKQFEHFVKWFLKNDPEWSTQVDEIWLWNEYPERWGADCGIDLIFRHKNGESWAVQAKCYSPQYDITKHDVDKFLSESNRKGIEKRLLIATTDRIGPNAKQVCEAQEKQVFRYMLSNFESANIEYPETLDQLYAAKRKPKPTPREHQLEAINNIVNGLNSFDRGQLIMACGTGKTFTTLWIKERLNAMSTLILLPSLGLLSQTLREWTLAANIPFDVLCVCSDNTVGKKGVDELIHSVADIAFPVTSKVEDIRQFLRRNGAKVVFSTYQSSPLVAEAQAVSTVPNFDLAIADEAHRCAGKVGSDFSTILDVTRIRTDKRLFATATPRTYLTNTKRTADERGIDIVGMDDERVFGKVMYSLPFGEAIKRGLLTDYQVVIIGVDNPTIASWIENRKLTKTESGLEQDAGALAAQIGLLKAYKDYDLRRVISFHSRVNRAEQFSKNLLATFDWIREEHRPTGKLQADFVSGDMSTEKRRVKLAQLKAIAPQERRLLTNARCLSEGVDVPSLDGVAFIDPRSSQIDIIQAVGRSIRLSANKTAGTIILPVFLEPGIDTQSTIEGSNFKPIWDVLNALRAHDNVLSAELNQIRTEMGRKAGGKFNSTVPPKIHIDLPTSIGQDFTESLRAHLVEKTTETWGFGYGELQRYLDLHGNCLVPALYKQPEGYSLGKWVSRQRATRYEMTSERRSLLEDLSGWTWNPIDAAWETGFSYLYDYSARTGNCLVIDTYQLPNGFKLGSWVSHQRRSQNEMSLERKVRLESLPGWTWNPFDESWEVGFSHLKNFNLRTGSCAVPQKYQLPDRFQLGTWVSTQRKNKIKISFERQARLEALPGWAWSATDNAWEIGFNYLNEYQSINGHCLVPSTFKSNDGYKLGIWVGEQRKKRDEMLAYRKVKLESLHGWTWQPQDEAWQTGFVNLCGYSAINGNCLVPALYEQLDGYKLGIWVANQRKKRHEMSPERKSKLEALPGWKWSPKDEAWEIGFAHLCDYVSIYGNCLTPETYIQPDGYKLGSWLISQRKRREKMIPERQAQLEALPGWFWDSTDEKNLNLSLF